MQLDSFTRFSYPLNFWNQLNLFFIFLADNIFKNFLITRKLVRSSYIIVLLFIKVEILDKLNFRFLISISSILKYSCLPSYRHIRKKVFFFVRVTFFIELLIVSWKYFYNDFFLFFFIDFYLFFSGLLNLLLYQFFPYSLFLSSYFSLILCFNL